MPATKGLERRIDLLERRSKRPGRIFFIEPGGVLPEGITPEDKVVIWKSADLTKPTKQKVKS